MTAHARLDDNPPTDWSGALDDYGIGAWRKTFPGVDLADVMRRGSVPPPRVCSGLLYAGGLHSLAGPPEAGKTTIAASWAAQMLANKGSVVWLDEESGREAMADRLVALDVDPADVDAGLHYEEFPGLRWSDDQVTALRELLTATEPGLVVFDSSAGFLAAAGLGENDNDATGGFYKRVLLRAARHSRAAVVVVDHVTKNGDGGRYARGAGAKLGYVDVAYGLERLHAFSRTESGLLKLTVHKDRRGYLHRQHEVAVHVDDGRISLTVTDDVPPAEGDDLGPAARKLLDVLLASDLPLTNAALVDGVAAKYGHGLRRETVSREMNRLLDRGLADCLDDGERGTKRWLPTPTPEGVMTCDDV